MARQEGDLPAARTAFEDSLKIRRALADRDPKNTEWQRDLSVSFNKLGELCETTGAVDEALRLYGLSLPIAERLAARAPTHVQFQSDLQITRRRIEQLQAKLS